jgi:hypothetical protein
MTQPTWQDRALAATHGNQSKFGCMIMAALDRTPDEPPRFVGKPTITSDGFMMCAFVNRAGEHHHGAFAGAVADYRSNVAGLMAHLDLNAADKADYLKTMQAWSGVEVTA